MGVSNEPNWTDASELTGLPQCGSPCGFTDNADFTVHPFVTTPEGDAASLLILGLGALGVAVMGQLRLRRKSS